MNLLDLTMEQLTEYVKNAGQPAFRAKQIEKWLAQGVDFSEMSDLPLDLRTGLAKNCTTGLLTYAELKESKIDGTKKFLFELEDGNRIESVLMKYKYGNTVCISSQAGCKMGCTFCASTGAGFMRNLTSGEMLGQVISINRYTGESIRNVVIMGIGEPLDNYDNVILFMKQLHSSDLLGISYRNISLSTCGLAPEIVKLSEEEFPITLSISLHSPFDEERSGMMPVNRKYNIHEVLKACRTYTMKTGRRITFEYAMIKSVNDSPGHAQALGKLLKGLLCHVNLIPVNEVRDNGTARYTKSSRETQESFAKDLQKYGIETTVRRELGKDISAACGQLRRDRR